MGATFYDENEEIEPTKKGPERCFKALKRFLQFTIL